MNKHDSSKEPSHYSDLTSKNFKALSSQPRFTIMLLLYTHGIIRIKDLSVILNLSKGNLDHHLKLLEQEQLVVRKSSVFPNRIYSSIEITEAGKKQLEQYFFLS